MSTQRKSVFEELGFSKEESEDLKMRTYLILEIRKFMERRRMTQVKAAEFFGVTQNKISYIKNGQIDRFSIDFLVKMLATAGGKLTYSYRQPALRRRKSARVAA